ncbi:MAG: ATP-binding protein [Thermoanaerobaculia bacterium]
MPLARPRRRVDGLLLIPGLLLGVLVLTLGGASFLRHVATFEPAGFTAARADGSWQVTAVLDSRTGLERGDRIVAAGPESPVTARELLRALHAAPETTLLVLRGEELVSVDYRRPPLDPDFPYLILALTGLAYLGVGLYTLTRDRSKPVRLFFLWTLASATVYLFTTTPPLDLLGRVLYTVEEAARLLLPPLTLHFFLAFPEPLSARRPPGHKQPVRWLPFLYLPAAFLALLQADLMFLDGRLLTGGDLAASIRILDRLELIHLVAFAAAAVAFLVYRVRRQGDREKQRQLQWITVGVAAGYAPFAALYVAPLIAGLPTPELLQTAAVLPLALVPLTFAWAILRYRLWDLGAMVRNGTAVALTVLLGVVGFALANLAISRAVPPNLVVTRQLIAFLTGLGIAAVMVPTRRRIGGALERLQYGSSFGKRQALRELGRELVHERDLERLATHLVERTTEALELERAGLLLANGDVLRPLRGKTAEDLPAELGWDELADETWRRASSRLSGVALPRSEPSPAQQLYRVGYRHLFPLRVRERRIGVLLASDKADQTPLSRADLELVESLTQQAALAIENALLLEEVRQRLDQVVHLKEYTERVLESSPAGIAVLDAAERVVSANPAFGELVGQPPAQLVGRPFRDLLPLDRLPTAADGLREARVATAGGERYVQLSAAAVEPGDDAGQKLIVVQDISDRVAMEKALRERERLASLGMLAAGVAHEVNTPITGISSYAQMMLSNTAPDDPHYELLKKVEKQTFRASRIVNSLLELSRDRHEDPRAVDLAEVIDSTLELLAERVQKRRIEVDWQPPPERLRVFGDEGQLDQVLANLVANAIDAMPQGGSLTLTLEGDEERVRAVVADTGRGIAEDELARIFEPFYSTRLGEGGTGLGLSISYNIVRRLGGELRVASTPGEGTRFTVELPRHRATDADSR